jgi:phospholipase C
MDNTAGIQPPGRADDRLVAPFRTSVTRRRLLQLGAAAGAAAVSGIGIGISERARSKNALASTLGRRTGTLADLKHVVILMQENRSFDHYFGSLRGVRGYSDKQLLTFQDGTSIFQQPDAARTDGGYLLPFHMASGKLNAQNAPDLDHSWDGDHSAMNGGAWNNWVRAKTGQTMGYFSRADIPFQYALADAFTICDGYHQAILGPTVPNRMYFWTGTSSGFIANPPNYTVKLKNVTTYPELLQAAGITWQVYTNREVGDERGIYGWVGDFGDNPLWHYQAYQTSMNAAAASGQELARRGAVVPWRPFENFPFGPNHVHHVLADFEAACAAGTLPQVSWIVAPHKYSEHPAASPSYGAHYVRTALEAMMGNQALWESSALFVTYDEHDGYFDHVVPPSPEKTTPDEFIHGLPIGFGPRVPMLICSPWTRGGFVDSNLYDHTSMLRFLETWTGVGVLNISAWRRSLSGDLTGAFDFAHPDFSIPELPDTVPLIEQSDGERNFRPIRTPALGSQVMPSQEPGRRPHRPAHHQAHADVVVDRANDLVVATLSNTGQAGTSLAVYPDRYEAFAPMHFTVVSGTNPTYTWDTKQTGGNYAFSVYGPDRFVRSFAGAVVPAGQDAGQVPVVSAELVPGADRVVRLTLANLGAEQVAYTLTPNDFAGDLQTVSVGSLPVTVEWPADADGYYDVIVTASTSDGFTRRYAGRIA